MAARNAAHPLLNAVGHHDSRELFNRPGSVHAGAAPNQRFPGILRLFFRAAFRIRKICKAEQELATGNGSVCGRPEDGTHQGRGILHRCNREAATGSACDEATCICNRPRCAYSRHSNIERRYATELCLFVVQGLPGIPRVRTPFRHARARAELSDAKENVSGSEVPERTSDLMHRQLKARGFLGSVSIVGWRISSSCARVSRPLSITISATPLPDSSACRATSVAFV